MRGAEPCGTRRRGRRLRSVGSDPFGQAALTQAEPHHLDRYQLDWFVWAGAMAVGALMLLRECGLERCDHAVVNRTIRDRHYQLVALAFVMQRRRPLDARTRSDKTF